jgi:hypothetical protein
MCLSKYERPRDHHTRWKVVTPAAIEMSTTTMKVPQIFQ